MTRRLGSVVVRCETLTPLYAVNKGVAGHRRWQRMNRPPKGQPWVWYTREMLVSGALAAMSLAARRVVERIMIEHMNHAGREIGNLKVTYDNFELFGIRRKTISAAVKMAVDLGFIDITSRGYRAYGTARRPATYALTWLARCDGTPASNRWKTSLPESERQVFGLKQLKQAAGRKKVV